MTDDRVVIGGKAKLRNVIKGNTSLRNVLNGSPGVTLGGGMSPAVKEALLDCFEHVAWVDDDGQVYYQALYDALYPKVLASITAVFNQGQNVIYDTDTLDDLTQYLTVTATYDDSSTATIASTEYTLSGTLNPGTSTITVTYKSKTTTFNVTVTHMPGTVTITNTLIGCTSSNSASSGTEGSSYSATITASSGYSLTGATVSITMGGVDITSSAYSNGTISIAELTGNLVITITAVAVTLVSISAVYTQSGTVYDTDSLDSLKSDLVVTATYSDSSTATVASTDYTLTGTLTVGTSTITVSYGGKTTTFTVTVSEYWDFEWVYTMGLPDNNGMTLTNSGGTISLESDGLAVSTTNTSSSNVIYKYESIGTSVKQKVVSELVFKITAFTNQSGGGVRNYAGLGGVSGTAKKCAELLLSQNGIQYLGSASGWSTFSSDALSLNTEYTLRIEQTDGSAVISLNGSVLGTLTDFREGVAVPQFTAHRGVSALFKSYRLKINS